MGENLMANIFSVRFADEFEKELYRLSKKYRNIQRDVEPIIQQLEQGIILGDRLAGFGSEIYVYKLRVKNSNIQKGKSAGYRLIYLLESALGEYFGEEQKGWLLFQLIHRLRSLGSFTPLKKLLYRHILKKVQF
jgi:mRNA-degrading endonuclease RelE of RelBE toxin-antitoxin system